MKNFKNNIFTILIALLMQTVIFAQEPNDFGYSSNNNDQNATDVPIDCNLWILLLFGLLYVYSKYKTVRLK